MHKDILTGGALNEAIPFGSVKPLYCSLLFHKRNSFRLSFRLKSPLPLGRQGCCSAGQIASECIPEPGLAIRDDMAIEHQNSVLPKLLRCAKASTKCALRDDRWELGIIFRNSGFCKALCFVLLARGGVRRKRFHP